MRSTILALLFFVTCAAVNPARAQTPPPPYPPPAPAPQRYPQAWYAPSPSEPQPMVHRKRVGLLIAGAVTVGVMQGVSLLVAMNRHCENETSSSNIANCEATRDYVWIPVVGPFVREVVKADSGPGDWLFAVGWGLAEIAGGVMFGVGLAGRDVPAPPSFRPAWGVIPLKTRGASGLALRLDF